MDDLVSVFLSCQHSCRITRMSLIEHLEELRKRLIHSGIYLLIGFVVAYIFRERLYGVIQAPLDDSTSPLDPPPTPTDGFRLLIPEDCVPRWRDPGRSFHTLSNLALHISPGLYAHEKRHAWPFMAATIGFFISVLTSATTGFCPAPLRFWYSISAVAPPEPPN